MLNGRSYWKHLEGRSQELQELQELQEFRSAGVQELQELQEFLPPYLIASLLAASPNYHYH